MLVPEAFREAVEKAMAAGRPGDLRLLSWEIHGLDWAEEGQHMAASAKLEAETGRAPGRVLLFTGHMIDAPGRSEPRFPAAKEPAARRAIAQAIHDDEQAFGRAKLGIAGAASGGDILFHELCEERGIETHVYLALPPEKFLAASVAPAGGDWEARYRRLLARGPVFVLGESEGVPGWLGGRANGKDYGLWMRNNRWMLHNAFAEGGDDVSIIALWNRQDGDGAGGTGDLVNEALERGAQPHIFDTRELFGL